MPAPQDNTDFGMINEMDALNIQIEDINKLKIGMPQETRRTTRQRERTTSLQKC